jgi:ABC-type nitrate/sulfonate/bicarbonate transport system substrate-binding protein
MLGFLLIMRLFEKENMKYTQVAAIGLVCILGVVGYLLWRKQTTISQVKKIPSLTKMNFALDWTPNTNHTGIYVALAKGWYKEQGIDLKILPYSSASSPDVLITSGKADVAVGNTEGVIADAATGNPVVSIAAIIQHNTSGFLASTDSDIHTPKDLVNKLDGGSGSPLETAVVNTLIKTDGGKGTFKSVALDADAMQALENKKIDFFWVFEGWEVIQAKRKGLHVVYFPSIKYGIPDYYTPVLITSPAEIKQKPELLKKFMAATKKGYDYAIAHPKEAAQILITENPKGTFPDTRLIAASQEFVSAHYVDAGRPWGLQDKKAWHDYPQFMIDAGAAIDRKGKPVKSLDFDTLYTNKFLQ